MQKLLMPAAEVLAMDATDSSCGDRLLKGMGKDVRAKLCTSVSRFSQNCTMCRLTACWHRAVELL